MKQTLNQLILYCTMGEELVAQDELVADVEKKIKDQLIAKIVKERSSTEVGSPEERRGASNAFTKILEIL